MDGFGLHPDQRWRRCAGLFGAESRVADVVALLKRLHRKSQCRAGSARAELDQLRAGFHHGSESLAPAETVLASCVFNTPPPKQAALSLTFSKQTLRWRSIQLL
ncbi:MAG: hypothetical protein NT154_45565 [Verrucomicrobia bacterium]|nr:hypothetical protein [Verrucomicrobiota bacterium]